MTGVLVTGGAGLIGSEVVRQLVAAGHDDVVVLDRTTDHHNLAIVRDQVTLVDGDLDDRAALRRTVLDTGVRRVIHLAGVFAPVPVIAPIDLMQVNVMGTAAVFELARELELDRVVWSSTINAVEFEDGYDFAPVGEEHRIAPRSLYGASKYACEVMAAEYVRAYGLDVVGIRPPSVYGSGRDSKALHLAVREAALGRTAILPDAPEGRVQPIHVVDMAAFLVAALFAPGARPITYNTPVLRVWTGAEIATLVAGLCPTATVQHARASHAGVAPVMDASRASADIGFEPRIGFEEGIRRMIEHYRRAEQSCGA